MGLSEKRAVSVAAVRRKAELKCRRIWPQRTGDKIQEWEEAIGSDAPAARAPKTAAKRGTEHLGPQRHFPKALCRGHLLCQRPNLFDHHPWDKFGAQFPRPDPSTMFKLGRNRALASALAAPKVRIAARDPISPTAGERARP